VIEKLIIYWKTNNARDLFSCEEYLGWRKYFKNTDVY